MWESVIVLCLAVRTPLATKLESSDIWKRHKRAGASSVTAVLRMKKGSAAGPVTLCGSRIFKSLWSPFQSTLLPLSGMVVVKYPFFRENIPFGDKLYPIKIYFRLIKKKKKEEVNCKLDDSHPVSHHI